MTSHELANRLRTIADNAIDCLEANTDKSSRRVLANQFREDLRRLDADCCDGAPALYDRGRRG
jgi:hypothetical protein